MANRIVHFEIQAEDTTRASAFYRDVFGWEIGMWSGDGIEYITVMTASKESTEPGINGGMLKRPVPLAPGQCGANAFVCTVQVDDYDTIAQKILAAGGTVAMPKFAIPGMAWQGYYLDTEGNTFGIHQPDPNARQE